jgi:crooked neck
MPELVWKAYIDFEEEEGEYDRTRALYERLLSKTDHVKVWTSYAHFEINIPEAPEGDEDEEADEAPISDAAKARARKVFERAHKLYRERGLAEERVQILRAWQSFEEAHGTEEEQERIAKQQPRQVKKRRKLDDDSFEEYYDYVFPADDGNSAGINKLMLKAQQWKQAQAARQAETAT